jgi:hypothetical protein
VRRWNHRLLAAPNQTPNCSRISFVIHRDPTLLRSMSQVASIRINVGYSATSSSLLYIKARVMGHRSPTEAKGTCPLRLR